MAFREYYKLQEERMKQTEPGRRAVMEYDKKVKKIKELPRKSLRYLGRKIDKIVKKIIPTRTIEINR